MKTEYKLNRRNNFRGLGYLFSFWMMVLVAGNVRSQGIDTLILNKSAWVLSGNYKASALVENPSSSSSFSYDDASAGTSYNSNFSAEFPLDLTPVVVPKEGFLDISYTYVYRRKSADSLRIEFWNADSGKYFILRNVSSNNSGATSNYCNTNFGSEAHRLALSNFSTNALSSFKLRISYNDGNTQAWGFCIKNLRIKSSVCFVNFPYIQDFEGITSVNASSTSRFVIPECHKVSLNDPNNKRLFRVNYGPLSYSRHPYSGKRYATVYNSGDVLFITPLMKFYSDSTYKFDMQYTSDGKTGFSYSLGTYKYSSRDSILAGKGRITLIDSVVVGARSSKGVTSINPYLGTRKIFNVSDTGIYYVALRVIADGSPFYFSFDDINIDVVRSTCFAPSKIVSKGSYGDSLSIAYTSNSKSTTGTASYQIDIGKLRTASGSGSLSVVSDTFTTLKGLTPETNYRVYVRTICGVGDTSDWSLPVTFNSGCPALYNLPYNYGFEKVSLCWNNDAKAKYKSFTYRSGTTPTGLTGPSVASQGSQYIFMEASRRLSTDTFLIYSPQINLDTNTNKNGVDIRFDYHMYGTNIGRLLLQLERPKNSGNYITLFEFTGQQQTSSEAAWKMARLILPQNSLSDSLLRFRFLVTGTKGNAGDIAVDNFKVSYAAACNFIPSSVVISEVTDISGKIKWVDTFSNITTYKVIYSRDTAVYGIEGTLNTLYDSIVINGLASGNLYNVYIAPVCGMDTSNFYSYLGDIITLCNINVKIPYNHGFETQCWTSDANAKYKSFTYRIGTTPSLGTGPSRASQGNQYAFMEASSVSTRDTFLMYSPKVIVDTNANKEGVDIKFDYHMYGGAMGRLLLQLEHPKNSGKYITLVELIGQKQASSGEAWKTARHVLSQSNLADTIKFRFVGTGRTGAQSDMAVDNFSVSYATSCNPRISGVVISEVTATSGKVKWVDRVNNVSAHKVIYSRDTLVYGIEGSLNTLYDSVVINGLISGNTYKVYIAPICGRDTGKMYTYLGEIATLCSSVNMPYSYSFEQTSSCWTKDTKAKYKTFTYLNGGTPTVRTGPSGASKGSQYIYTESNGVLSTDTFLIYSPQVVLDTNTYKEGVNIRFDYHMYGVSTGKLLLQVERPKNSGNYTTVLELAGQKQTSSVAAWKSAVHLLSQSNLGDSVLRFRFLGTGNTGDDGDMGVDNFRLEYAGCYNPSKAFREISITSNSARFASNHAIKNRVTYQVKYDTSGIALSKITKGFITTDGLEIKFDNLVPNKQYTFYARTICKNPADTIVDYINQSFRTKCTTVLTEISVSRSDSTLDARDDKDAFDLYTTNPNSYNHVWTNSMTRDSVFTITSKIIKDSGAKIENRITVEVTDVNGCKGRDTALVYYKDKGIVNLGEVKLDLKLYPNPSRGIFRVEMDIEGGLEYVRFKVIDLTGRLVRSYSKEQGGKLIKKEIDLSDKSEGIYILMIETERGVIVSRLSLIK